MNLDQWMAERKRSDPTWSDAKLAQKVGVSRPFIARIRSGKRQPSLEVLLRLSEITGLPATAFKRDAA